MRRTSLLNDKLILRHISFSNWFWDLYQFTDTSQFWDRGITMSKQRSFWLHSTSESVSEKKISRKFFFSFLQLNGFFRFLLRTVRYNSLMRKYTYNVDVLRLCSAAPLHMNNSFLKKQVFFDFLEKIDCKYFFYSYIFFKKNNHKQYRLVRPNLPVFKGSDLFLTGSFDFSNILPENVVESVFFEKNFFNFIDFFKNENTFINFFFIFDIFIIQTVEIYKSIILLFLLKSKAH